MNVDSSNARAPLPPVPDDSMTTHRQGQPSSISETELLRHKVYLAIIVALLAFLGSLGGSFVNSRLEESRWRRESSYVTKKEILLKRMDLLERNIRVINRMQTLELVSSTAKFSIMEGADFIRSGKSAQPALAAVSDINVKIKEVQADLSVAMTLDMIYFGTRTKEAVGKLEQSLKAAEPWWKVDTVHTQALINALGAELYFDLTDGSGSIM